MTIGLELALCRVRECLRRAAFFDRAKARGRRFAFSIFAFALGIAGISGEVLADAPPAMFVPGQFNVGASGGASYSIPITAPPGTAGMAPALSLSYSSQGGDGIVGLRWALSGLPSIGHCPRTYAQESVHGGVNYDSNDRFCMGGQRLVAISGTYGANATEYRTEIDGFSRIISYGTAGNGPAYFKVWTKAGQIMEFGNTTDSRVLAVGKTTARSWAVNKVSDIKGNYLAVTYTNDATNGQVYPTRIDYTGNAGAGLSPYNSVQFTYNTSRPDVTPTYQAGSLQQTTVLLTDVKTYQGSSVVYDYQLAYTLGSSTLHSELATVTLCDGASTCLAPTTFTWQGGTGLATMTAVANSSAQQVGTPSGPSLIPGEFNGDGLTDFLAPNATSCGIYFGTATGFSASGMTADYTQWYTYDGDSGPVYTSATYASVACLSGAVSYGAGEPEYKRYIDFDGDGLTDVLLNQFISRSHSQTFVLHNNGSALNQESTVLDPPVSDVGDFDGDGRTDVFALEYGGSTYQAQFSHGDGTFGGVGYTGLTSSSLPTALADFDGDGCTDMIAGGVVNFSCNPATATASVPGVSSGARTVFADFNGDGKTDMLVTYPSSAGTLYLSTGTGFVATSFSVPSDWGMYTIYTGDFDGDGRADLLLVASGGSGMHGVGTSHQIWLSTGNGFSEAGTIPNTNGSDTTVTAVIADWNSDGASDIWLQKPSGDTEYLFSYVPQLITSVANGIGATTTITYDRLNKNGTLYQKCANGTYVCGDSYPTVGVDGPFYVVSRVDASNGIGGTHSSTYSYAGAKTDLHGRGFLGFSSTTLTDLQTGIVQQANYRTDFPYTGVVSSQSTVSGSVTLNSVTNTFANSAEGTGTDGVPYNFVSLSQSVVASNDLDGTALPGSTTSFTYDSYGNPLTINQSVTDGSSKDTTNTYSNDATNWFLGRLTNTSVATTVPDTGTGGTSGNHAPTAADDSVSTNENTAATFDPRTNDTDVDGDALAIISTSTPSHGTVVINSGTSLTYTPATGYNGSDSFTYTISDGQGHTASATVSVTVVNRPPTANNDSVTANENSPTTFDPRTNDSDPDGDTLTITAVGTPGHGTAVINSGTSITYTPTAGYNGSDSFSYTISDGQGHTASATVSITIVNRAPTANSDSETTNENTAATFDPRTNDTDPDGDTLTITSVGLPGHGAVIINSGTTLTYTPTSNYYGTDSFTYTISDGHSHTATATVTMTVAYVNVPPVANNDSESTNENTAATFDPRTNDSDADGDTLTITAVSTPTHGTVAINSGTSLTYTPASMYSGTDSFTYTISDGHSHTATATVSMFVAQVNQPPVANNDSTTTNENTAVSLDPRANDTDVDGDTLTITAVGTASHGTVTINSGTSVTYTPTTGYSGSDIFTYTISDGHSHTATANVSVTVVNRPPVANNDSKSTNENAAVTFDPRSNDSDPDGDTLTITTTSAASHGSVAINSGTSLTYTPTTGYSGSDSFTYTISDSHGHTATATVTMTVVNRAPTANNDSTSTNENTAVNLAPRTNDTDPEGDALTISATGAASHGSVTNYGTSVTYTPSSGYSGSDSFTYTVSDGHGNTASATISVTIVNRPPTANNDSTSTYENVAVTLDPRSNDTDPDGDTLSITATGGASHGSVAINSGTSVTYTPGSNYYGSDSFTYTVSDGNGHTASATVSVSVVNRLPIANNDSTSVDENSSVNFDPRGNDSDPNGIALTISSVGGASHGSVTNYGTSVTYTPATNYYGSDSFTYTISDGQNTATATVSVTVNHINQPPVIHGAGIFIDQFWTGKLFVPSGGTNPITAGSDSDPDGDTLSVISVTQPSQGTATFTSNEVSYTLNRSIKTVDTTDSFTCTISDGHGHTGVATVSVTVLVYNNQ